MFSAISFGVFCRSAPSTSAIMRSRKLFPGSAVTRITSQSETTVVPPVTDGPVAPGLADHGRAFAGDRAFVDRGHAAHRLAIGRDDLARRDMDELARRAARSTASRSPWRGRHPARPAPAPGSPTWSRAAYRPAPCRALRPAPRRSWRTGRRARARPRCAGSSPRPARRPAGRAGQGSWSSPPPRRSTNITGLLPQRRAGSSLTKLCADRGGVKAAHVGRSCHVWTWDASEALPGHPRGLFRDGAKGEDGEEGQRAKDQHGEDREASRRAARASGRCPR